MIKIKRFSMGRLLMILGAAFMLVAPQQLWAQSFTDIGVSLSGIDYSSAAWGDYDSDGDLDILLTGQDASSNPISKVYRNDGSGTFTDISAGLAAVRYSAVAWGDYDSDGDLDILLTGYDASSNRISKVYRNDGSGTFTDIGAALAGIYLGSVAWGDYDNDGDLDILLTGLDTSSNRISKVYRNDGAGTFTDISAGLIGVYSYNSVAWGDYDSDGDLDILLTGQDASGNYISKVYRYDGSDTFTDIVAGLVGVRYSDVAWGDYDSDGDLDILLTGQDASSNRISKVYRNDGSDTFTDIGAALTGVYVGSADWGDSDNDGDLDIMLTGFDVSGVRIAKIYRNDGSGTFTDIGASLTGVYIGSVAWGDYDNDRDLDILLTGNTSSGGISKIYRNESTVTNAAPSAPSNLTVTVVDTTTATLKWNAASDSETAAAGLNYNVYVGTATGKDNVRPAQADLTNGFRRVAELGQVTTDSLRITGLSPDSTYYWSVQAIDAALAGGSFATETNFTTGSQSTEVTFAELTTNLAGVDSSSTAWGDYNNDGNLDILLTGKDASGNAFSEVYTNSGNSTFTALNAGLQGVYLSSTAWGDYDNNGYLDILLSGSDGTSLMTKLYKNNNGDGTFTEITTGIEGIAYGSVAWGDYNSDGHSDILLSGYNGASGLTKVYKNNGDDTFTSVSDLAGTYYSSVAWGDYDNDGYLDIVLSGNDGTSLITKLYKNNNGDGTFTEISSGLVAVDDGSLAWGDYNSDGYLDILLSGWNGASGVTKVYKNNGDNTFTSVSDLAGVYYSSGNWGDYDNDGDLDVLLTGTDGSTRKTEVYANDGGDTFTVLNAGLTSLYRSSSAWGDYDNDGDLDILLTGNSSTGDISTIYRNDSSVTNATPSAPSNLAVTVVDDSTATLKWNAASDTETAAAGLNYNVYVGTAAGKDNVRPAQADLSNGFRRVAELGQVTTDSLRITGLSPDSTYYWSVQAIDAALAGGSFATETNFTTGSQSSDVTFTELTTNMTGVNYSSNAWGDYDNDGDLDILLTGRDASGTLLSEVYTNNGDETFTALNAGLTDVYNGSVAWGDYDTDGYLDILLTGRDASNIPFSEIYTNNGDGTFTALNAGLAGVYVSSVAWGDYDNDGDLDILLTGLDSSNIRNSEIYTNNGDGTFTALGANLPDVYYSSAAWGDYDNDGDLDVLLSGNSSSGHISEVYMNNGDGTFTTLSAGMTGVYRGSVAWGDYDGDGDLDIMLTGQDASGNRVSKVYRNDGNGTFTDIGAGLQGVYISSAVWGDSDNDGDLDILLTGLDSSSIRISEVYTNNGDGTFTALSAGLTGVYYSSASWGDYENDGDLDILLTGTSSSGDLSTVYRNDSSVTNAAPSAPSNLAVTLVDDSTATLKWNAASDSETAAAGLNYNVYVGTATGKDNVRPAQADLTNGFRRVAALGQVAADSLRITGLSPDSTYYWSVQAIDAALAGGSFASEASFEVSTTVTNNSSISFDGTDDFINFGSGLNLVNGGSTLTISGWVKPSTIGSSTSQQTIIAERNNGDNFQFAILGDKLYFSKWSSASETNITGVTAIQAGQWYHVAVTYDGSTVTLYLDGNLEAQESMSGTIDSNTSNLYAGSYDGTSGMFTGLIYDLQIWNISRSQSEINSQVNTLLEGTESGLAGYWPFTEGTGTTTGDFTANNNDGTLLNGTSWSTDIPVEDTAAPSTPTGIATSLSGSDITISWNANSESDLSGYRLYRKTGSETEFSQLAFINAGTNSHIDSGLNNNESYSYTVTAVDTSLNESGRSEIKTENLAVPSAPTGITAEPGSQQVRLDWNDNASTDNIQNYKVYQSADNTSFSLVATPSSSQYTKFNLTDDVTYYFYVTAVNTSSNESAASDTVNATPGSDGPDLIGLSVTPGSVIAVDSLITLSFDQSINTSTVGSGSGGIRIDGSSSGSLPFNFNAQDNNKSLVLQLPPDQVRATESVSVTILTGSNGLQNNLGLGFDGNGNGSLDGSPSDDSTFTFKISALGDYTVSGGVDMEDLVELRNNWGGDSSKELGPVTGEFPFLSVQPDNKFDIEDLLTFIRYWNWTVNGNSVSSVQGSANGVISYNTVSNTDGNVNFPVPRKEKDAKNLSNSEGAMTTRFLNIKKQASGSLGNYLDLVATKTIDKYQDVNAKAIDKKVGYELRLNYPDSLLGAEIVLSYDPSLVTLKSIRDNNIFESVEGRTIFISSIDEARGKAVINAINFSKLGAIDNQSLASLEFEMIEGNFGNIEIAYDLRDYKNSSRKGFIATKPAGFEIPNQFILEQNYPNPFNPQTTIQYQISDVSEVKLLVYDVLGRKVATLVDQKVQPGFYKMQWNAARNLASGLYLYVLDVRSQTGNSYRDVRKMTLIK